MLRSVFCGSNGRQRQQPFFGQAHGSRIRIRGRLPVRSEASAEEEEKMKAQGYCVKCKSKKAMADAAESLLKNGRKAIKGKCPTCGTGMFKIVAQGSSKPARRTAPKTETDPTPEPSGPPGHGWTLFG